MKTIIVPTDFSDSADNALKVAKYIAQKSKATLYLVNFYSIPMADYSYPEISMPAEILEQARIDAKEQVAKIANQLKQEGFAVETSVRMGMASDEIVELAEKLNSDLIIMGTTGASGILNKVIGSNAAHVMQRTKQPILLVPQNCICNGIENVVYLDELKEDDTVVLTQLFALAEELEIKRVRLLNINTSFAFQPIDEQLMTKLNNTFGAERIQLETVDGANVKEGMEHYLEKNEIDLVVMSTYKKTLLERIFVRSDTNQMALYSKVPVLVYHKD